MSDKLAPYRHTEIVRVEECCKCMERREWWRDHDYAKLTIVGTGVPFSTLMFVVSRALPDGGLCALTAVLCVASVLTTIIAGAEA
jgi:hypothetical protein